MSQPIKLQYIISTEVHGDLIHQNVAMVDAQGNATALANQIIDTQEAQVREALQSMGWTPPKAEEAETPESIAERKMMNKIATRYHDAMEAQCTCTALAKSHGQCLCGREKELQEAKAAFDSVLGVVAFDSAIEVSYPMH